MERGDLSSESGGGGMNPVVYESDMLTFTTDVRMEKVRQIEGGEGGDGDVGGEVEAVFWVKDVMTQWRVKGRAFVVGGESGDRIEEANRARIWAGMRARWAEGEGSTGSGPWSWEKEVTAHFANMSPIMRGRFPSVFDTLAPRRFARLHRRPLCRCKQCIVWSQCLLKGIVLYPQTMPPA